MIQRKIQKWHMDLYGSCLKEKKKLLMKQAIENNDPCVERSKLEDNNC